MILKRTASNSPFTGKSYPLVFVVPTEATLATGWRGVRREERLVILSAAEILLRDHSGSDYSRGASVLKAADASEHTSSFQHNKFRKIMAPVLTKVLVEAPEWLCNTNTEILLGVW